MKLFVCGKLINMKLLRPHEIPGSFNVMMLCATIANGEKVVVDIVMGSFSCRFYNAIKLFSSWIPPKVIRSWGGRDVWVEFGIVREVFLQEGRAMLVNEVRIFPPVGAVEFAITAEIEGVEKFS